MINTKERVKKWLIKTILALEMLGMPMYVQASPVWHWNDISFAWLQVYVKLVPWIRRISAFLVIIGAVKVAEGYAREGTYGITGGIICMIAGGILYATFL